MATLRPGYNTFRYQVSCFSILGELLSTSSKNWIHVVVVSEGRKIFSVQLSQQCFIMPIDWPSQKPSTDPDSPPSIANSSSSRLHNMCNSTIKFCNISLYIFQMLQKLQALSRIYKVNAAGNI